MPGGYFIWVGKMQMWSLSKCKHYFFNLVFFGFSVSRDASISFVVVFTAHSIYWFWIVILSLLIIFNHLGMPKDLWMSEEMLKSRTLLFKYQMFSLHWENFCLNKKNYDLVPCYVLVIASFTSKNVYISFLVSIICLSYSLKGWNLCVSSKEE